MTADYKSKYPAKGRKRIIIHDSSFDNMLLDQKRDSEDKIKWFF
jgi:hypothetical protein